jgi:hypothetical protein
MVTVKTKCSVVDPAIGCSAGEESSSL